MKPIKEYLKETAVEIKALKAKRKSEPNGYVTGLSSAQFCFRVHHIVACLQRGRTLEQIESSRVKNPPDSTSWNERQLQSAIANVMEKYKPEEVELATA